MLLRAPVRFERLGAVTIYDVAEVVSLDNLGQGARDAVFGLDKEAMLDQAARTAIVVPVKDEDLNLLEGVISAIPTPSPLVLVSASSVEPIDMYSHEVEMAVSHGKISRRRVIVVHQHDPAWGEALAGTPLEGMLGERGVRGGKGEGMILGVLVAAWLGARNVGFIDSDNYIPGSVNEYAKAFYTALAMAGGRHSMVRIVWYYKGKMPPSEMLLRKWGRVSLHTNAALNKAISLHRKVETGVVKTANSGEHAMTMSLALSMPWAGGYAVETYELVHMLESCYLRLDIMPKGCRALPEGIKVLQVETRNPHIHAEKGESHISGMAAESLGTIYYSGMATEELRAYIRKVLSEHYYYEDEPPAPRIYDLPSADPAKIVSRYMSESRQALDTQRG